MNPVLRNILSVVAGVVIGGIVNMAIVIVSGSVIPPPAGADLTTTQGLQASMHLMEPKHFLMPFLAHALGTLIGAFIAAKLGASRHMMLALIVGAFFLVGGISAVLMLPSPAWFTATDLLGAYLPMGYLGGWLAQKSGTGNK
jgi:uncharacterized membrane protein YqgA involved in biofilm formation